MCEFIFITYPQLKNPLQNLTRSLHAYLVSRKSSLLAIRLRGLLFQAANVCFSFSQHYLWSWLRVAFHLQIFGKSYHAHFWWDMARERLVKCGSRHSPSEENHMAGLIFLGTQFSLSQKTRYIVVNEGENLLSTPCSGGRKLNVATWCCRNCALPRKPTKCLRSSDRYLFPASCQTRWIFIFVILL